MPGNVAGKGETDNQPEQCVIYQVMICAIKKNEAGKENEDCCELVIIFKLGGQ